MTCTEPRPEAVGPGQPASGASRDFSLPSFVAPHPRLATPDLARGGMLLLIALANVPIWFYAPWWGFSGEPEAHLGPVSQIYEVLRTGLVDHRAYPLFALLFGFGLATMAPPPASPKRSDPQARLNRKLLRRRGWWMMLFGFVHCLLFMADIIGPYGFAAVLLAGLIAHRRRKTMIALAVLISVLSVVFVFGTDAMKNEGGAMLHAASGAASWYVQWPVINVMTWLTGMVLGTVATFVVPAAIVGVMVADSGVLRDPQRRVRLAWKVSVVGLGLGFLASLPQGLIVAEWVSTDLAWAAPLNAAAAPLSALGWVAVFVLVAAKTQGSAVPSRLAHVLTAVGRRSMTAYLGQSVLFALSFAALAAAGLLGSLTPVLAGLLAVAVWSVMAALCVWLDAHGIAGPFERLLRWLVRRTARNAPPAALGTGDSAGQFSHAAGPPQAATPGR